MLDAANKKSSNICPPSLPNYYTDGKGTTGCTDGALNNERTAPVSMFSKTCKVYPDKPFSFQGKPYGSFTQNDFALDSCSTQKRKEIGKKQMSNLFGSKLVDVTMIAGRMNELIGLTTYRSSPSATVPQSCLSNDELIYNMQRVPLGSNQAFSTEAGRQGLIKIIKLGLFPDTCEAQKAIFIDKSMTFDTLKKQRDTFIKAHPELAVNIF
jgi:hypothetical protein